MRIRPTGSQVTSRHKLQVLFPVAVCCVVAWLCVTGTARAQSNSVPPTVAQRLAANRVRADVGPSLAPISDKDQTRSDAASDTDATPSRVEYVPASINTLTTDITVQLDESERDHLRRRDPRFVARETINLTPLEGWAEQAFHGPVAPFCYRPLYFEDAELERYGKSHGCFQSFISAARFYNTFPLLPYKMTVEPPDSYAATWPEYPEGYYAEPEFSFSLGGALIQAGVVTGMILLIP